MQSSQWELCPGISQLISSSCQHQAALHTQTPDQSRSEEGDGNCLPLPRDLSSLGQKGFAICTLLSLNWLFVHLPQGVIYCFFKIPIATGLKVSFIFHCKPVDIHV